MSTLVTQLYLLEKYGLRLTTDQLAEVLTSDAGTILNPPHRRAKACAGGTQGFRPAASAAHARPSSGGVLTRRHWPMVLGATPSTSAARRSDRPMWVSQASNWAGVIMGCGRPIQRLRGAAAECGQAGRPG